MAPALQPVVTPRLLAYTVKESIQSFIVENGLRPGDPLPSEGELARQLTVSRNSVREAVRALEALGYVETRRGSGLYVGHFSFDALVDSLPYGLMEGLTQLDELLELRRVIEMGLVEEVVNRIPDDDIEALRGLLAAMRSKAQRVETFPAEDRAFHRTLLLHRRNDMLLKLLDVFWLAFRVASDQANIIDPDPVSTCDAHEAILNAVVARDAVSAREALDRHYDGIKGRLRHARQET